MLTERRRFAAPEAVLEWCRYLHNHAPSQDLRGLTTTA